MDTDSAGTPPRDLVIAGFLARSGFGLADAQTLPQDASFRRYLRFRHPRAAMLMDAPPPEDVRAFLRIATHLRGAGVSVPDIIDADPEAGLVLEEDFGDDLLSTLLDRGDAPRPLLSAAVEALAAVHRAAPPAGLPDWGRAQMTQTALGTLFDWWWPARYGAPAPDAARSQVAAALDTMLACVADGPRSFVHRDYFAGNLLWLPERSGARRVGIIDFQTAALGHPAYDLASLLQDARRDIPEDAAEAAMAHYLALRPELEPLAFRTAYDACAAQRHLRVACQWVRLAQRDKRPQYLRHGPRTWRLLNRALERPVAAPLAKVLSDWIPLGHRGNPPDL